MRNFSLRAGRIIAALVLAFAVVAAPHSARADQLYNRSVTVASPLPSANTSHLFRFTYSSVSPVGSIEFEYCINTPFVGQPCTAPPGLNTSAGTLQSQAGETGFSVDAGATNNRIILTRTAAPTSAVPATYNLANVVNQGATNTPVYVRVATYASEDATGPRTDEGAVVYSTSSAINVEGYVPPYLTFCVGVTVALNCSSANGSQLNFGELSSRQPRFVSSQFSVATNDPAGYATTVTGTTMMSGNNIIPAIDSAPQPSVTGQSQFGMNLRANGNPAVGADRVGSGVGQIAANYNNPNQFYFKNATMVTSTLPSDFNIFTVSYVTNVSAAQQAGVYVATMTYIATAAF